MLLGQQVAEEDDVAARKGDGVDQDDDADGIPDHLEDRDGDGLVRDPSCADQSICASNADCVGIGNGVFHPVDFTLLNRKVHQSRLGHAFSVHGITGSLGWALAPAMLVPLTLASRGFVAVVPDMPCLVTFCDHDANAAQISALLGWAVVWVPADRTG